MDLLPPPAPRRKNRVTVFLTDSTAAILREKSEARELQPGQLASAILEKLLPQIEEGAA